MTISGHWSRIMDSLKRSFSLFNDRWKLIPFRVRRRFQKSAIRKAGLWKLGYAHFLPQQIFCEFEGEEIISHYFSIDNLAALESFLQDYGISFSSTNKSNRSQMPIQLEKDELERISSVYADDLLFYKSKLSPTSDTAPCSTTFYCAQNKRID